MHHVDPTPEGFRQLFAQVPADTPVTMLNLLRFREQAVSDGPPSAPARSGRQAYADYTQAVLPLLVEVGGRVVWRGCGHHALIGPADEVWDEVLLVEYPSTAAFATMIQSDAYRAIVHHRTAAVLDSRLIATTRQS